MGGEERERREESDGVMEGMMKKKDISGQRVIKNINTAGNRKARILPLLKYFPYSLTGIVLK